jgi:nucleotide-binding universal stress UspA family protein
MLLGSTSDFVATHAPCSVLVVRPPLLEELDRPLRIAIGYEPSGPAQAALEEITEIHWGPQVTFDVVSVVSFVDGFLNQIQVDPEEARQAARQAVDLALEQLHLAAPRAEAHLVECDHPGEGLVLLAEDKACDLLVVGETPRNFLGRILLGSTSRFVLRHAPCSVWITRNRMIAGSVGRPLRQDADQTSSGTS